MAKIQTKTFQRKLPFFTLPDSGCHWVAVPVEFPTATLAVNDLVEVCELPADMKVLDYALQFPDIDSNGTPTFAFSIGTENEAGADLAVVWDAGLQAGRTASTVRAPTSGCSQADATADRKLALKVTTAAATWAGATKVGHLLLLVTEG